MRRLLLVLVPALAAVLVQTHAMEGADIEGLGVTFDVISYASQEFSIGYMSDNWSSGTRYELNGWAQLDSGRVQPGGGVYLFYENRDWKGRSLGGVQETGDLECFGFGLQGGATINLLPPEKKLGLALVPYARGGLGFQDFTAKDVIIDNARYNLSDSSGRMEVAAGIDLRLTIASKIEVVFGGGVDYWSAASVYLSAGTGGAGAAVGSNGTFTGTDAWLRLGAGLHF